MTTQETKGKRQPKKETKAQLEAKYKVLESKVIEMASNLASAKVAFNDLVNNPYGKPLKHEDGTPMVLRFEDNGITISMYDKCAVVSCLSNQWIAQDTTASYAILYRMVSLSRLSIYDENTPNKEGMMTEGQYEDFACGYILCFVKCLNLVSINKENELDNHLLYITYDAIDKYMKELLDEADKIVEENPNTIADIIQAETEMGNMMAMQKGLKDINDKINKE